MCRLFCTTIPHNLRRLRNLFAMGVISLSSSRPQSQNPIPLATKSPHTARRGRGASMQHQQPFQRRRSVAAAPRCELRGESRAGSWVALWFPGPTRVSSCFATSLDEPLQYLSAQFVVALARRHRVFAQLLRTAIPENVNGPNSLPNIHTRSFPTSWVVLITNYL